MKQQCEKRNDLNVSSKDLNGDMLESIETAVISHESILNLEDQDIEYFDHSSLTNNVSIEFIDCEDIPNSYSAEVGIGHTNATENSVNTLNLEENVDQNMQVNLEMQVIIQTARDEKERARDVIDLESNTVAVETKLPLDISKTKLTSKTTNTHFIQHEDGSFIGSRAFTHWFIPFNYWSTVLYNIF